MRAPVVRLCVALLLCANCAVAAEQSQSVKLQRGVPADAFLAVYHRHNAERDFQRKYYEEVWRTVQETQIIERAVKIVTDRIPQDDLEKAQSVLDALSEAAAPIDFEAMLHCEEAVYAQFMEVPSAGEKRPPSGQHLVLVRLAPEQAMASEEGFKNLFGLVEKYSEGKLTVQTVEEGDATITTLSTPKEVPIRPTVARLGEVLLLSTSDEVARRSLAALVDAEGTSKFDDPRVQETLKRLPEPEDSLIIYDGKLQLSQLRGMGAFLRQVGQDNPNIERIAGLVELLLDELAILDCQVTVEYTEDNLNRSATFGTLVPGAEEKLLAKVLGSGEPFEDWQTWVPADAISYSLTTGVNLHPLYVRIVEVLEERVPEAQPLLEKFNEIQAELGVNLDEDILQAFSGEFVSVSVAAGDPSAGGKPGSVTALRCRNPERVRELLDRLVEGLQEVPAFKAQQIKLIESEELEGFEELSVLALAPFGVRPLIGFRDGWMILGSNAQAVKKVLATRAGEGETIADTEAFKQFKLEVEGPVRSIGYRNLAESTRGIADFLNRVGFMAPAILGMAGAQADPEKLKPVQEALALLPSAAKIVRKFDFLEAKLSVTQSGDEPGTFTQRAVTVVRAQEE
ncbi:MAG: hypothetical protein ABIP48_15775 [Planctomycetota bacterium]